MAEKWKINILDDKIKLHSSKTAISITMVVKDAKTTCKKIMTQENSDLENEVDSLKFLIVEIREKEEIYNKILNDISKERNDLKNSYVQDEVQNDDALFSKTMELDSKIEDVKDQLLLYKKCFTIINEKCLSYEKKINLSKS